MPDNLAPALNVLYPYKRSLTNPPRSPLVQSAATNKNFFSALNNYVLRVSKSRAHYQGLISFWAGITTEALVVMIDSAKSGRREIERRNTEDILVQILPVLHSGFALKKVPDLIIACYMICVVIASKCPVDDTVLDSLMEVIAGTWTQSTLVSGIVCLSVLTDQKRGGRLPEKVVKSFVHLENAAGNLAELSTQHPMSKLVLGLVTGCILDFNKQNDGSRLGFVEEVIHRTASNIDILGAFTVIVKGVDDLRKNNCLPENLRLRFSEMFLRFNDSDHLKEPFQNAIHHSGIDADALELSLQTVFEAPAPIGPGEDILMADAHDGEQEESISEALRSIPQISEPSFFSETSTPVFNSLARLFVQAFSSQEKMSHFVMSPQLGRDMALKDSRFISFFVRFFCGPFSSSARAAAINAVTECLDNCTDGPVDVQALLPYLIFALADPAERVRRETTRLFMAFENLTARVIGESGEGTGKPWGFSSLYGHGENSDSIRWLPAKEVYKFSHRALMPALEEYVLDSSQVEKVLEAALNGSSKPAQTANKDLELKKALRADMFSLLCSHVIATPNHAVKLRLLQIINRMEKVGSVSRTQELLPLFKKWRSLSEENVTSISKNDSIALTVLEREVVSIVSPKNTDSAEILLSSVTSEPKSSRQSFVDSVFERLREIWPHFKDANEGSIADIILNVSLGFSPESVFLKDHCKELLRAVDLSTSVLVGFTNRISSTVLDVDSQSPAKKRRRTSQKSTLSLSTTDPTQVNHMIDNMTFVLELLDGSSPENHPPLLGGLFQTLAALHHLKLQLQSDMSYLTSLTLGIMLAIVNRARVCVHCPFTFVIIYS